MAKAQLKVATIVGSSTAEAWSQTYHAGGVTAIVCVQEKEAQEKPSSLSLVGKDLLNTFESEYFTLETKSLAAIKDAVSVTYNKSKDTHNISLIVAAVIQNAVYVVLAGSGKILLIRKGAIATLLGQTQGDDILSASGFLEAGDMMILETLAFEKRVSSTELLETLSHNSLTDAVEMLSPSVHKEKDGAATALLFQYEQEEKEAMPEVTNYAEVAEATDQQEIQAPPLPKKTIKITHRQKIFLTIAVVLAIVFIATIYLSLQRKQTTQNSTLFSQLYPPAEKKYEEGQGLMSLNSTLAHDDFVQAQQMLSAAKGKFSAGSSEEKQILNLLDKVNAQLTPSTHQPPTAMTKVATGTDIFLDFANKHTDTKYIAQDDTNFYFADSTGITKVAKSGGNPTQIIKNGGDWKTLGGFGTYLGNMYVLDTTDGIDKYAVTSSGFGSKAAYFVDTTPDLSKAVSITIDGSIWILGSNGSLVKYTKGQQDSLTLSGLTQQLTSPTQITTTVDDTNVYILDNGNSRLVVIKKDGSFVAQYTNPLLQSASMLDVQESAKKTYVLSGGTVYELDMK